MFAGIRGAMVVAAGSRVDRHPPDASTQGRRIGRCPAADVPHQLGVVDDDTVSLSNLQRQIIHTTPDIGRRKVDSAAEVIHARADASQPMPDSATSTCSAVTTTKATTSAIS